MSKKTKKAVNKVINKSNNAARKVVDETKHSYKDCEARGEKLKRFQKELLSNPSISPTQLAFSIYNCKKRYASAIASENLKKLGITMTDLMNRMGLDDEQDVKDFKRLRKAKTTKFFQHEGCVVDSRDVDDNATQLKALELTQRIKGNLKDSVVNNQLNVQLNLHEIDKNAPIGDKIREFASKLSEGVKSEH